MLDRILNRPAGCFRAYKPVPFRSSELRAAVSDLCLSDEAFGAIAPNGFEMSVFGEAVQNWLDNAPAEEKYAVGESLSEKSSD